MRLHSLFAAILFGVLSVAASQPVEMRLWADTVPPVDNGLSSPGVFSREGIWLSDIGDPSMTVFPAEKPNGTALLMCPGGGYAGVSLVREGSDFAPVLNDMGITLAVLSYRMPCGHHSVPLDDARRALKILRDRAQEWGINPERIGIGGASAGGHLASTVATHLTGPEKVAFQVLFYPVITMDSTFTHGGSRLNLLGENPSQELVDLYSNEKQVTAETPRAFIATGSEDCVVPVANSYRYFEALNAVDVDADMHIYPTVAHGWTFADGFPFTKQWQRDLRLWLSNLYD